MNSLVRGMRFTGAIRSVVTPIRFQQHRLRSSTQSLNATESVVKTAAGDVKPSWDVRLLYDGECPLCLREVNMLMNRDKNQNKISFVNIASEEYNPVENQGITYGQAMGRIHGILPNGQVIVGVEVFRRCYEAIGLGWIYALTKMKPLERVANMVYDIWARYRLPITGRSSDGIEDRILWKDELATCADSESCEIPWGDEEEDSVEDSSTVVKST
eukprot:g1332.t1